MNWMFPQTKVDHQEHGCFHRYVFHTRYQADQLVPQLRRWGYRDEQGTIIRGAFYPSDFAFRPKPFISGEMLCVGRLSRGRAPDKWPADLWHQYRRVPYPVYASVMGWDDEAEDKCGPPPAWAETLPACKLPTAQFLAKLHVLVPGIGCCEENWSRVGLEAMAAGVAVVVEHKGGWPEMIADMVTGHLCKDSDEQARRLARIVDCPEERIEVVEEAREALTETLADVGPIWPGWRKLLMELNA